MKNYNLSLIAVLIATLLFVSASAHAADTKRVSPKPPAKRVSPKPPVRQATKPVKVGQVLFNFQAADIQAVVKTVSQLTGRNFILDPRVKGKITIISAHPVSRYAAYQIFLSALKAQGFTAVPSTGGVTKIVPVGEGKQGATTNSRVRASAGDQMVTHVIVVQHGTATQLVPLLRPLMAPTSQLSAYAPANALVITDYAQNVRRLSRIIDDIDQPISSEVTVIPLKHASALDLADLISRLQSNRASGPAKGAVIRGGVQVSIIPDLRTNSLLVRSSNPGQLTQLKSLVTKLDVVARSSGTTRVVYLRNAEAKKLVEVLRGLLTANPASKGKKGGSSQASFIQADEASNSLIINASDATYNNLRSVIEKLDARRAQVYVEALITEVKSDKTAKLGFQWAGVGGPGGAAGGVVGMTNFPGTGAGIAAVAADPTAAANLSGFSLAYLGPEISLPDGSTVRGLGGLANALVSTSNANILSTPNILTLDNAEAKIVVGQNVPFLTGSYAQSTGTSGATVNPFQTIERKDIGLTLKIKPQISEGGTIKLEIFQEVSSVTTSAVSGATDLVTNKRTLETTVVVDDGHTIVLGGLIEDTTDNTKQKVPMLGSIPVLGALFRYKSDIKRKTNLMIFLRPTIIRSATDSRRLTADRYQILMNRGGKLPKEHKKRLERFDPVAPPVSNSKESPEEKMLEGKALEKESTEF